MALHRRRLSLRPWCAQVAKLPGVHWQFRTRAHAPELTAGIFNCEGGQGYSPIMACLAKHGVTANFTCAEMDDEEQPAAACSSPQSLLLQVRLAAAAAGVPVAAENALPRFDARAHDTIVAASLHAEVNEQRLGRLVAFTYLRMGEQLFHPDHWLSFVRFAARLRAEARGGGAAAAGAAAGALMRW